MCVRGHRVGGGEGGEGEGGRGREGGGRGEGGGGGGEGEGGWDGVPVHLLSTLHRAAGHSTRNGVLSVVIDVAEP